MSQRLISSSRPDFCDHPAAPLLDQLLESRVRIYRLPGVPADFPRSDSNARPRFKPAVLNQMPLWVLIFSLIGIARESPTKVRSGHDDVYRLPSIQVFGPTQSEVAACGYPLATIEDNGEQRARITNMTGENRPREADDRYLQRVDHLDFVTVKMLQHNRMHVVTHPNFDTAVLIKIANSPMEMPSLEQEAKIYSLLHGSGIAPEFLGYVTKGGQTIGIITEYIREMPSSMRNTKAMQNCLNALHGLHRKGIAHGDAHDGNCLIREDGSAVLIDFELSVQSWSLKEFERDLDIMSRCIQAYSAPT